MKNWITFLGTGFGVGWTPLAPGTMGTLVGVVLYLVFSRILPHPLSYAIMIVVFTVLGAAFFLSLYPVGIYFIQGF